MAHVQELYIVQGPSVVELVGAIEQSLRTKEGKIPMTILEFHCVFERELSSNESNEELLEQSYPIPILVHSFHLRDPLSPRNNPPMGASGILMEGFVWGGVGFTPILADIIYHPECTMEYGSTLELKFTFA